MEKIEDSSTQQGNRNHICVKNWDATVVVTRGKNDANLFENKSENKRSTSSDWLPNWHWKVDACRFYPKLVPKLSPKLLLHG